MNFARHEYRPNHLPTTPEGAGSLAEPPLPEGETDPDPRHALRRRRLARLGMAASLAIFAISLVVLWHIAAEVNLAELRAAFTAASRSQIASAVGLSALSYGLLTGYDALALRQMKQSIPYRITALASFASYAVSFNLGFPLLTGGAVRYRIYGPAGLSAGKVAGLTIVAGLTFWLGMGAVLGWSLLREPGSIAMLTYSSIKICQALGLAAAVVVVSYLAWVSFKRRSVRIQGWRLELPGFRLSLGQMLIGIGDVCAAAAVLFVLLPQGHGIGFETFLALYVLAAMLGIASHSPGGLGVFEATILLALSSVPREGVLGALLLFRICYYFVPFAVALACLGAYEIAHRLPGPRGRWRSMTRAEQP